MAISLTTEGLRLDYRTSAQTSVSGKYPIGTVIVTISDSALSLPGTWVYVTRFFGYATISLGAGLSKSTFGIRIA